MMIPTPLNDLATKDYRHYESQLIISLLNDANNQQLQNQQNLPSELSRQNMVVDLRNHQNQSELGSHLSEINANSNPLLLRVPAAAAISKTTSRSSLLTNTKSHADRNEDDIFS